MRKLLALIALGLLLFPLVLLQIEPPAEGIPEALQASWLKRVGGALFAWFNLPGFLLLGAFLIGGTLLSSPLPNLGRALVVAVQNNRLDAKLASESSAVFKQLASLTMGAGLIGFLCALIPMIQNLSDPSLIGPLTSYSLFPIFYSALLGGLFFHSIASDIDARAWPLNSNRPLPIRRNP